MKDNDWLEFLVEPSHKKIKPPLGPAAFKTFGLSLEGKNDSMGPYDISFRYDKERLGYVPEQRMFEISKSQNMVVGFVKIYDEDGNLVFTRVVDSVKISENNKVQVMLNDILIKQIDF